MQEINISQKVCSVNNVLPDANGNVSFNLNYGRTEPTLVESIVDWEAMATACNITVADLKNVSNASYGTLGYGGDSGGTHIDGIEFKHGDIIFKSHVTLGSRNVIADGNFTLYDKILVITCSDDGARPEFSLWERWELEYAHMTLKKFSIIKGSDKFWCVNGGDHTRYSNFEPMVISGAYHFVPARFLCDDDQNCVILDILGIKY